jgi:predicted GH43/DUF377 family glycosyl hydrolase
VWYTGIGADGFNRILYASSVDGFVWSNFSLSQDKGTYRLEPDVDYNGSLNPSVVKIDSVYHMWYEGLDQQYVSRIIHCISNDGVNWTGHKIVLDKSSINRSDLIGVGDPCVLLDMDTLCMWFVGYGNDFKSVFYATSVGGDVWSNVKGVLSKNNQGVYDLKGLNSFNIVLTRDIEPSGSIMGSKLKIYNGDIRS